MQASRLFVAPKAEPSLDGLPRLVKFVERAYLHIEANERQPLEANFDTGGSVNAFTNLSAGIENHTVVVLHLLQEVKLVLSQWNLLTLAAIA